MQDHELRLDDAAARQVLLVRAIEESDPDGRLLGAAERSAIEQEVAAATRSGAGNAGPAPASYLPQRASRILAVIARRQPRLASLRPVPGWQRALAWLLPLGAVVLGAALDRIDSPGQINMLSPPLLAVLLWNLLAYLLLVVGAFWPGLPTAGWLQRALAGLPRLGGRREAGIAARFHALWLRASARRQLLWGQRLLHATAAGWAIGLALSIILGGLVRQYRVGWESTLLDLQHVHTFLSWLFTPVVAWLPFEPFSAADLERMHFASGAPVGVQEARRWLWMYLALLALLVIVPRLLLAAWAGWRHGRAAGARVDLRDPYFRELLARVLPTRVSLALLAQDPAARARLLGVLHQLAGSSPPAPGEPWTLVDTAQGDTLQLVEVPPGWQPARVPEPAPASFLQRLLVRLRAGAQPPGARRTRRLQAQLAEADLVLMLPGTRAEVEAAEPLLAWFDKPVLLLVQAVEGGAPAVDRDALRRAGLAAETLDLAACTRNWTRDSYLLDALRTRLPAAKGPGFERLAAAWRQREQARLTEAMRLLAGLLARAAGEFEELELPAGSLRRLFSPAEREAERAARQAAMEAVLHRLRAAEHSVLAELARLHGLQLDDQPRPVAAAGDALVPLEAAGLGMHEAVVATGGAATGAAVGASIDLMTGGLTLGAATALGALIGGSASYAAAAWRKRETPAGRSQVQLSDEMLQALAENLLLHYLAAAERSRTGEPLERPVPARWRSEVVAAVEQRREPLQVLWQQARSGMDDAAVQAALTQELEALARELLARLPAAQRGSEGPQAPDPGGVVLPGGAAA